MTKEEKQQAFEDYDNRGVRAFVRYQPNNGKWAIECYRKRVQGELNGKDNWRMIREGHINAFHSREEAEIEALKLAQRICEQYNF